MAYFDEYPLQDYYNYLQNPQGFQQMGSMEPMQNQQLGKLLDRADNGAAQMAQQAEQANAQMAQASQAANAQREAFDNATMQQAQQAAEQQKAKQDALKGKLLSLGLSFALGGMGGGGEAAEATAGGAGEKVTEEMVKQGAEQFEKEVMPGQWLEKQYANPESFLCDPTKTPLGSGMSFDQYLKPKKGLLGGY